MFITLIFIYYNIDEQQAVDIEDNRNINEK